MFIFLLLKTRIINNIQIKWSSLFWQFQETLRLIRFSEKIVLSLIIISFFFIVLELRYMSFELGEHYHYDLWCRKKKKKERKKDYTFWPGTGNAYALKEAWRVLHHSYFWWSFVGCKHLVQTRVPESCCGAQFLLCHFLLMWSWVASLIQASRKGFHIR